MGYSKLPYTAQVFCVKRPVTDLHGQNLRSKVAYGITRLSPHKADPARLLSLNRHHWSIENRVHWVRDVPIDEDRSQVRKNAGPNVMASLRNLTISFLRMAGAKDIARSLRSCSWNRNQALRLIGIVIA